MNNVTLPVNVALAALTGVAFLGFLAGGWAGWKLHGILATESPPPDQSLESYYQDTVQGLRELEAKLGKDSAAVAAARSACQRIRQKLEEQYVSEHLDATQIAERFSKLGVGDGP